MARIAGVSIPDHEQIVIGLQHIYGIGLSRAKLICQKIAISPQTKVMNLSEPDMEMIRKELTNFTLEGDLRRQVSMSIKRLIDSKSYRGIRHTKGLPVRGQRTKTNARTRKGPRKAIAGKKK